MQIELDEKEIIHMINLIDKIPSEDLNINNEQDDEQDVKRKFLDIITFLAVAAKFFTHD